VSRADVDPFVALADRLMGTMRAVTKTHAAQHVRFVVEGLDPLEVRSEDETLQVSEEDDDVEVFAAVEKAITDGDVVVGTVLDGRETRDGWELIGVVAL
jgi:hypothetical protein